MVPEKRHFVFESWPESCAQVKFRLIYDGELPPADKASADVKHAIRKQLHPQLRNLWDQEPVLQHVKRSKNGGLEAIATEYAAHGFRFVPLVRLANEMGCRVDVLMLMRQEPYIFSGVGAGDLDNRIKTLLDGLRMPTHQRSDFGSAANSAPADDEDPFYCLVEDDKTIYELAVKTDRLLAPVRQDQKFRDVVAIIDVHVTSSFRHDFAYLGNGFELMRQR